MAGDKVAKKQKTGKKSGKSVQQDADKPMSNNQKRRMIREKEIEKFMEKVQNIADIGLSSDTEEEEKPTVLQIDEEEQKIQNHIKQLMDEDDEDEDDDDFIKKDIKKPIIQQQEQPKQSQEQQKSKYNQKGSKNEDSDDDEEDGKKAPSGGALQQNKGKWEVLVKNINEKATEDQIKSYFDEKIGEVVSVKLIKDRQTGESRGTAFVVFEGAAALCKAIEISDQEFMGQPLTITNSAEGKENTKAEKKKAAKKKDWEVIIKNLSVDADENDIGHWFEEKAGSVDSVKIVRDRSSGESKGLAFVAFEQEEGMQKALKLNGSQHMNKKIKIMIPGEQGKTQKLPDSAVSLFVGNLSFQVTDQDLMDFFSECGEVLEAKVAKVGDTNKSRGFGHVYFKDYTVSQKALEKKGQKLKGRPVKLNYVDKKNK